MRFDPYLGYSNELKGMLRPVKKSAEQAKIILLVIEKVVLLFLVYSSYARNSDPRNPDYTVLLIAVFFNFALDLL